MTQVLSWVCTPLAWIVVIWWKLHKVNAIDGPRCSLGYDYEIPRKEQ